MVPGRRQNVLGIRGRLRRTRHLGISLHDMDDDVRNHRTRTEQRRRPARRTEGTAQSQYLYGQSQKFQRLAQQPVETLRLCARHLRGECGGRYRGDGSDMRFERRRTCGALQHRPKPRNTDGTDTARTRNGRPLRKYRQNQRIHLRRGGRVPGRGGGSVRHGCRCGLPTVRRHPHTDRICSGDGPGTLPRSDMRPGLRACADSLHRTQCGSRRTGLSMPTSMPPSPTAITW